jgi:hypothetical protein
LESREARVGTSVGVLDGARRAGKGRVGTIEKTYGHPDYLAVDVRFDDGSAELYWYYELRTIEPWRSRLDDGNSSVGAVVMAATKRTRGG